MCLLVVHSPQFETGWDPVSNEIISPTLKDLPQTSWRSQERPLSPWRRPTIIPSFLSCMFCDLVAWRTRSVPKTWKNFFEILPAHASCRRISKKYKWLRSTNDYEKYGRENTLGGSTINKRWTENMRKTWYGGWLNIDNNKTKDYQYMFRLTHHTNNFNSWYWRIITLHR